VVLIFLSVVLTAKPSTNFEGKEPVKKEASAPQAPTQKPTANPATTK
jgi:hypothetical protein